MYSCRRRVSFKHDHTGLSRRQDVRYTRVMNMNGACWAVVGSKLTTLSHHIVPVAYTCVYFHRRCRVVLIGLLRFHAYIFPGLK